MGESGPAIRPSSKWGKQYSGTVALAPVSGNLTQSVQPSDSDSVDAHNADPDRVCGAAVRRPGWGSCDRADGWAPLPVRAPGNGSRTASVPGLDSMDPETQVLLDCLESQRGHVLGILDGLTDEELQRAMLPSGWAILGLVNHLALDVERFWFREVVAGERLPEGTSGSVSAWRVSPETPAASVLDSYRQEIQRANVIVASTPLGAEPSMWPDFFGEWRLADLRAVLLHVIAETACHAGHLDAARELIDGRTWLKLT